MAPANVPDQRVETLAQREAALAEWEARLAAREARLGLAAAKKESNGAPFEIVTSAPSTSSGLHHLSRTAAVHYNGGSLSKENGSVQTAKEASEDSDAVKVHEGRGLLRAYLSQGRFLRSVVFGGLDGLTTTMAVICSVSGIGPTADDVPTVNPQVAVSTGVIVTLGIANTVADAFSMGIGDFLSSLADSETDGTAMASRMEAVYNGVAMFLSFIIFGFIPLCAFMSFLPLQSISSRLRLAAILFVASLFLLGTLKAVVVTANKPRTFALVAKTGVTMILTGSVAAIIAYVLSLYLHSQVAPLSGPTPAHP